MNTTKSKVSFLLFVIFIVFYSTMYNPHLYFISFLATTFFILLEKTQITQKLNLPFKIPYQPIIILCILILGFLYLYTKFFKREHFKIETIGELKERLKKLESYKEKLLASGGTGGKLNQASGNTPQGGKKLIDKLDEKILKIREELRTSAKDNSNTNSLTDKSIKKIVKDKQKQEQTLLRNIKEKLGDEKNAELNDYIGKLLATQRKIIMEEARLQMNLDKQNIEFQDRVYKVQKEIEKHETNLNKKRTPLDKKNLLLFKQQLTKHMPEIGSDINKQIIQLFTDPQKEEEELTFIDKVIESIRRSYKIVSKEDRMVYVGTTSLIISFALMLLDISL